MEKDCLRELVAELSKLAGLLILLHSFYGTNCCWNAALESEVGFGNQLIALYQGTTLVVPPPAKR
jgi:hypothetical protein